MLAVVAQVADHAACPEWWCPWGRWLVVAAWPWLHDRLAHACRYSHAGKWWCHTGVAWHRPRSGSHGAMTGFGLLAFGAEGCTEPFTDLRFGSGGASRFPAKVWLSAAAFAFDLGAVPVFPAVRWRPCVPPPSTGCGRPDRGWLALQAGRGIGFACAAAMGAVCGIPIAPFTTIFTTTAAFDRPEGVSGGHHRRVGQLPRGGGPPLAAGGLAGSPTPRSGLSAYKEVIVFTLILPVLLWRSLAASHHDEEEDARNRYFCSFWWPWSSCRYCPRRNLLIIQRTHRSFSIVPLGLVLADRGWPSFGQAAFVGWGLCHVVPGHGLGISTWLGLFAVWA